MLRFNAHSREGLADRQAPDHPGKLNTAQREALVKSLLRADAIARDKGTDRGRIEVWFADEARIGQKNKITRRWERRGTRPSAPHDQRTASTYIFGAICPSDGKGAALVLPACNTEAMNLHLAEIAAERELLRPSDGAPQC